MEFLLADPEDEALWEGILYPSSAPSSAAHPSRCQSLLLDGVVGACTPGMGERRLRSALRAVGGGGGGGGDGGRGMAATAMLVLRGFCRLARLVFFVWGMGGGGGVVLV